MAAEGEQSGTYTGNDGGCSCEAEACCVCVANLLPGALRVRLTHQDDSDPGFSYRVTLVDCPPSDVGQNGPRFDGRNGPRAKAIVCDGEWHSFDIYGGDEQGLFRVYIEEDRGGGDVRCGVCTTICVVKPSSLTGQRKNTLHDTYLASPFIPLEIVPGGGPRQIKQRTQERLDGPDGQGDRDQFHAWKTAVDVIGRGRHAPTVRCPPPDNGEHVIDPATGEPIRQYVKVRDAFGPIYLGEPVGEDVLLFGKLVDDCGNTILALCHEESFKYYHIDCFGEARLIGQCHWVGGDNSYQIIIGIDPETGKRHFKTWSHDNIKPGGGLLPKDSVNQYRYDFCTRMMIAECKPRKGSNSRFNPPKRPRGDGDSDLPEWNGPPGESYGAPVVSLPENIAPGDL